MDITKQYKSYAYNMVLVNLDLRNRNLPGQKVLSEEEWMALSPENQIVQLNDSTQRRNAITDQAAVFRDLVKPTLDAYKRRQVIKYGLTFGFVALVAGGWWLYNRRGE